MLVIVVLVRLELGQSNDRLNANEGFLVFRAFEEEGFESEEHVLVDSFQILDEEGNKPTQ